MTSATRDALMRRANQFETKAQASVRPADKSHWLLQASSVYDRAGCHSAARLTRRLAEEALAGGFRPLD